MSHLEFSNTYSMSIYGKLHMWVVCICASYMCTCVCACVSVCVHACMCACIHVRVCVCACMPCLCVCVRVCVCVCTYTVHMLCVLTLYICFTQYQHKPKVLLCVHTKVTIIRYWDHQECIRNYIQFFFCVCVCGCIYMLCNKPNW